MSTESFLLTENFILLGAIYQETCRSEILKNPSKSLFALKVESRYRDLAKSAEGRAIPRTIDKVHAIQLTTNQCRREGTPSTAARTIKKSAFSIKYFIRSADRLEIRGAHLIQAFAIQLAVRGLFRRTKFINNG